VDGKQTSGSLGMQLIGGFKVACALLFLAVGVGLFRLLRRDVAEGLEHGISLLRLDPQNETLHAAIGWVSNIDHRKLKAIGFGSFFYAALYLVEGIGLLARRRWAGYLTVVATGSLILIEGYEIYVKPTPIRVAVLVVNVAIVAYLVWNLRREGRDRGAAGAGSVVGAGTTASA